MLQSSLRNLLIALAAVAVGIAALLNVGRSASADGETEWREQGSERQALSGALCMGHLGPLAPPSND